MIENNGNTDLATRLLASENITVVRVRSKTAWFDVKARVLNLPNWTNMSPLMEELLRAHEVGHALETPESYGEVVSEDLSLKSYINIVEDARIEKLMKRKFPGLRKVFFNGYKEFAEKDIFKLKDKVVSSLLLIDRINIHFKLGFSFGVEFTNDEMELVNRVESVETFDDVIQLSKDIYDFSKRSIRLPVVSDEENAPLMLPIQGDKAGVSGGDDDQDDYDDEPEFDDDTIIEGESSDGSSVGKDLSLTEDEEDAAEEVDPEELESVTDEALTDALEEMADVTVEHQYFDLKTDFIYDPIVPYKQVLEDTKECNIESRRKAFDTFMQESNRVVSYLVKEFEMRKAADQYQRSHVSKSGSLNVNKLHAYKLTENLFKTITVVPNGKNHGMVFLLDWSGSMENVILPTIKQVINLAMFCRRINIPFEVFAFTDGYYSNYQELSVTRDKFNLWREDKNLNKTKEIYAGQMFNLLQLFSSKMSSNEFNTMARRFTQRLPRTCNKYKLNGTPLNEALLYMKKYLPEFKHKNLIEKMSLLVLSDGGGSSLTSIGMKNYLYEQGKTVKIKNFMRDGDTVYPFTSESYTNQKALLTSIKASGVSVIGFYITRNKIADLKTALKNHYGYLRNDNQRVEELRAQIKANGYGSFKDTGHTELFLIIDKSTEVVDEEIAVDGDMSANAISKKFGKMLNSKKNSRVFLDKFIDYIA